MGGLKYLWKTSVTCIRFSKWVPFFIVEREIGDFGVSKQKPVSEGMGA